MAKPKKNQASDAAAVTQDSGAQPPGDAGATPPVVEPTGIMAEPIDDLMKSWSVSHEARKTADARIVAVEEEIARRVLAAGEKGGTVIMPNGESYRARKYENGPMAGRTILVAVTTSKVVALK